VHLHDRPLLRSLAVDVVNPYVRARLSPRADGEGIVRRTLGLDELVNLGSHERREQPLHRPMARLLAGLAQVVLVRFHHLEAGCRSERFA
jgi:hypothetical protein